MKDYGFWMYVRIYYLSKTNLCIGYSQNQSLRKNQLIYPRIQYQFQIINPALFNSYAAFSVVIRHLRNLDVTILIFVIPLLFNIQESSVHDFRMVAGLKLVRGGSYGSEDAICGNQLSPLSACRINTNIINVLPVYIEYKSSFANYIILMKKIAKFAKKILPQQLLPAQTYKIPCKYGNQCKFLLIGTCKYFHPWPSYEQSCKHILNCPDYSDGACKYHKPGKSLNCYYGLQCKYYDGGKGKCRNYHPKPQAPDHQIQMMMSKLDLDAKIQIKQEPFKWYVFNISRFPKKSTFREWMTENWVFDGTDVVELEKFVGQNARIRMKTSAFEKLNGKLYNGQAVWFKQM